MNALSNIFISLFSRYLNNGYINGGVTQICTNDGLKLKKIGMTPIKKKRQVFLKRRNFEGMVHNNMKFSGFLKDQIILQFDFEIQSLKEKLFKPNLLSYKLCRFFFVLHSPRLT